MLDPKTGRRSRQSALLCGAIYLCLFLVLASVLGSHFGFPLDDSWIHEVIARNLVTDHTYGFVPGKMTSGSTSPLWTLVLSVSLIAFPHVSPVLCSAAISGILMAGIGYTLKRITEEDGVSEISSWCLALAPALSGNFLWFGLIGMEHLLFILLCLLILERWTKAPSERGQTDRVWLAVLCFLVVLARPEGLFLAALLLFARRSFARSFKDWMFASAGIFCGVTATVFLNRMVSGEWMPATLAGRRIVAGSRLGYLHGCLLQLLRTWNYLGLEWLSRKHFAAEVALLVLVAALLIYSVRYLVRERAKRFLLLCLWAMFILALYFLKLPTIGHGGRYVAIPLMVFYSLILLSLSRLLATFLVNPRVYRAALAGVMVIWAVDSLIEWKVAAAADIDQINTEHGGMATWMLRNMPAELFASPRVAVFDIGRIGYGLNGNLIDLGGLVDAKLAPYILGHRTAEYLKEREVRYVVLPGRADGTGSLFEEILSLNQAHGVTLRSVVTICADPEAAHIGILTSYTAAPCQTLYTIEYGVEPGLDSALKSGSHAGPVAIPPQP